MPSAPCRDSRFLSPLQAVRYANSVLNYWCACVNVCNDFLIRFVCCQSEDFVDRSGLQLLSSVRFSQEVEQLKLIKHGTRLHRDAGVP
jgi:hypothetical protein